MVWGWCGGGGGVGGGSGGGDSFTGSNRSNQFIVDIVGIYVRRGGGGGIRSGSGRKIVCGGRVCVRARYRCGLQCYNCCCQWYNVCISVSTFGFFGLSDKNRGGGGHFMCHQCTVLFFKPTVVIPTWFGQSCNSLGAPVD